jgi:tight adherence protein C
VTANVLIIGVAAIGLAIGLLVTAILSVKLRPRSVAGAITSIERHYTQVSASPALAQRADALRLPTWARSLALRLSPSGFAASLQHRLDVAGNPASWTGDRILALKGLGLLAGVVLGSLYGIHSPARLILAVAVVGAAGFFLPDVLLYNAGIKRQARILTAMPDALDMLTVCVEAGLGFDSALAQVARNTTGPLAEEFARALQEMQIGRSRTDALRGLADRTTAADLRTFVSALVQAGELGVPIGRVLREQASEMRIKRRQRAEERAQKVPVKIMFPLIVCIFPALLVVIIGPGILRIAHALFGVG